MSRDEPVMARFYWKALLASVVCLALASAGLALERDASAQEDPVSVEAILDRVAHADGATYRARQLVVYFGEPQSAALLDVRSSPQGRFVRAESGGDITRLWSGRGSGVVAGGSITLRESSPVRLAIKPDAVLAKYAIEAGPPEHMLGVELVPLTLLRRSDDKVVERWWVHGDSGVVYRRGLYDPSGDLLGMSTIIDIHWGDSGAPEPMDLAVEGAEPVRKTAASDAPAQLAGGYRLVRTYALEVDGRPSEQWVYSDGLHALSVFRTAGHLRSPQGFSKVESGPDGLWAGPGPGTWLWEGEGRSWMLVAEEPGLDPAEMTAPFPNDRPSLWARMGAMWSRLAGAIGGLFR